MGLPYINLTKYKVPRHRVLLVCSIVIQKVKNFPAFWELESSFLYQKRPPLIPIGEQNE
jgi:hypothetical protein